MSVALVTGVSSGIGNATAQALAERGYRVFGTVRSETSAVPSNVERVLLDVRDAAAIAAGVREVLAKAGRIDLRRRNALGARSVLDTAALVDVLLGSWPSPEQRVCNISSIL